MAHTSGGDEAAEADEAEAEAEEAEEEKAVYHQRQLEQKSKGKQTCPRGKALLSSIRTGLSDFIMEFKENSQKNYFDSDYEEKWTGENIGWTTNAPNRKRGDSMI